MWRSLFAAFAALITALPLAADVNMPHGRSDMGMVGEVSADAIGIDPTAYLSNFNFSHLTAVERSRFYRETALADGRMLREYWITAFDREIEIAPGVKFPAWTYNGHPIRVRVGELVRIYLVNILEFDETNSFHLHANFFDEYRTGTRLTPDRFTDIITMGQAERSILEVRFRHPGRFMFHAHETEFSELGWMGLFEVTE